MPTPGTVSYPAAFDDVISLLQTANQITGTLSGGISNSTTSIVLSSGTGWPSTGTISIENEIVFYNGKSSATLTGCLRGQDGTSAAAHLTGAAVSLNDISRHHQVHSEAIIATQTKIGSGASTPTSGLYLRGSGVGTSTWSAIQAGDVPSISAALLTSGTVPDARFPATLPVASGVNLTALNASNLGSGTVPLGRLSGITDTQISVSAAIAYSKLNLSTSILNADINSSAAIVDTKLATISTAGKVADSALSSNVPLLDAVNVFTTVQTVNSTLAGSSTGMDLFLNKIGADSGSVSGLNVNMVNAVGSTANKVNAVVAHVANNGDAASSINNLKGVLIALDNDVSGGTIGTTKGLAIQDWTSAGGSIWNTSYGIYIDSTIDVGTTRWAIYSLSTSASLLAGNLTVSGLLKAGSGPTTLTDSVGKILPAAMNTLDVSHGGSGLAALAAYGVLCGGTTSTNNLQQVSGLGTAGQILTSNGAGALPTWQSLAATSFDRLVVSPTAPTFDLASGVLAANQILSSASLITVASGKIFDYVRSSKTDGSYNVLNIGANATVDGLNFQLQADAGSDATSILHGIVGQVSNKSSGAAKAVYGRATLETGSTGVGIAGVFATTTTAGGTGYILQLSGTTNLDAVAYVQPDSGTADFNDGVVYDPSVRMEANGAFFKAFSTSGHNGDFLNYLNQSAVSLFKVDKDGALSGLSASIAGFITSASPTAGIGYATGAGGTVTQATSKTTGVTLNKTTGTITLNNSALLASAEAKFTVTNSSVAATDIPIVVIKSGGTSGAYMVCVSAVAAGSFDVTIENVSAGSLSEAVVLSFAVLKGVAS